jgi:hypothetical protein
MEYFMVYSCHMVTVYTGDIGNVSFPTHRQHLALERVGDGFEASGFFVEKAQVVFHKAHQPNPSNLATNALVVGVDECVKQTLIVSLNVLDSLHARFNVMY